MSYKKVGCYKDNGQKKRPLPQLLFTDRHYLSPVYSGRKFIKDSFDRSYLDDLVERCASKCKQLGYDIFGIGKFGKGVNETLHDSFSLYSLSLFYVQVIIIEMSVILFLFIVTSSIQRLRF